VVEDDRSLRAALTFAFESDGFEVQCYSDASELFRESEAARDADCLVIDHRLPHMDGLSLLAALREQGFKAPAILMTSLPNTGCRRRARAADVEIVEKPLLTDELRRHVHKLVPLR